MNTLKKASKALKTLEKASKALKTLEKTTFKKGDKVTITKPKNLKKYPGWSKYMDEENKKNYLTLEEKLEKKSWKTIENRYSWAEEWMTKYKKITK